MFNNYNISWSAWAPGISSKQEWQEWVKGKRDFDLESKPDISFIKPMVRRRLSSLAKMVFATAKQLLEDNQEPMSLVFASRYGEMGKTVQLLTNIANKEGLSPTSFGLSVHNSLVGMFGLIRQWTTSSTAIGAGANSLLAGLIEAYSQSKTKQAPVLYFYYDEPLPEIYQSFDEGNLPPICIGLMVDAQNASISKLIERVRLTEHLKSPLAFLKFLLNSNG